MRENIKKYWENSNKVTRVIFWICLIVGVCFMVAGFILPPLGIIDNSVLIAFGEIQGFAALGVGLSCIDKGMDVEISKGDTKIKIGKDD